MGNDILKSHSSELKELPYSVPEGYFRSLKAELQRPESHTVVSPGFLQAIAPYASLAAAFILFVTAGTFIMKKTAATEGMTYEDYLVHSDYMITEGYEDDINIVEHEDIDDEDIIEYLIYSGITAEALEQTK